MRNKFLFLTLLLVFAGSFIYAFNLDNSLFWDDDEWIKGNIFVHSFSYLKEIFTQNVLAGFGLNSNYYRPLLLLSFAFNYAIQGVAPLGYHLLSNGFHIANGVLVFVLLSRFINFRGSFIAALIFLVHPVQTEAVSYISGRGDPMSVFFMLLSLWLFVKSINGVPPKHFDTMIYQSKYFYLSLLFAVFAILSRETAVLFPLLLMVFYISFISRDRLWSAFKKSFFVSSPFWAVSVIYGFLRLTVLNFENTLNFYTQPNIYTENLLFRLYTFSHALVEYFKILFVPVGLHMERDLPVATSLFQWPVWLGALMILAVLVLAIRFYRLETRSLKLEIQPNSNFRIWLFGWSWFFIAMGPVSGIVPINAIMYEHWLYLPLIGLAVLFGFYADKLFEILKSRNFHIAKIVLIIGLVIYFSFFSVQSIKRNILWGKPIEFYEDILKYNPSSVRVLTNLGNLYSNEGNLGRAAELYQQAIESPADNIFAQPHYNLGNIYRDIGEIDKAVIEYKKAIEVDPNFPFAYQNLAVIYANQGELVLAIENLEKLKEIQPGNPRVYYNLGLLYLATNNNDLAIKNFEAGFDFARGRDLEVEQAISEILNQIR